MALHLGSLGGSAFSNPYRLPGAKDLVAAYYVGQKATLSTVMRATGTSPPVVALSGNLSQNLPPYIRISTGGLGAGQFDWSLDGGVNYVQTGQTISANVGLGSTGITAVFPVAITDVYNTDQRYQACIETLGAIGPSLAYPMARSVALGSKIVYERKNPTINYRDSLLFDGSIDLLTASTMFFGAGNDQPYSVVMVGQFVTVPTDGHQLWCSQSVGNAIIQFGVKAGAWESNRRDDSGSSAEVTGGTSDLLWHVFATIYTGTRIRQYVGQTKVIDTAQDTGVCTPIRTAVGGAPISLTLTNVRFSAAAFYNSALDDYTRSVVVQNYSNFFKL